MVSKAECTKAGKALSKNGTSAAGKKLAQCRWGSKPKKKPTTKKSKAAPKAARKSRRLAGQALVRQPEPPKKPRKKGKKKKKAGGKISVKLKKVENILVPGLNPPKGDMKSFLQQQMRLYGV